MQGSKAPNSICVVLAEPDEFVRLSYIAMLNRLGVRNIVTGAGLDRLKLAFSRNFVDLAIIDSHAVETGLERFVKDMRFGRIGRNPFANFLATVTHGDRDHLLSVIRGGVDDVIMKPMAGARLRERVMKQTLIKRRYLATPDYLGPDWQVLRFDPDKKRVRAPSSFSRKIGGEAFDGDTFVAQIADTCKELGVASPTAV